MSQYPSAPPPGPYTQPDQTPSPAQGFHPQQPQYGYQQPQAASSYGAPTPGYGPPASSHKPSNTFDKMFGQAVTQGKPMLNKLGKTISSKLGSKPSGPTTPQHLQNYHSYQQHHQQTQPQAYQDQGQHPSPQAQQQQHQTNAYSIPQSPFPQSNHASPTSGHPGQINYFPHHVPQTTPSYPQAPQQQSFAGYNPSGLMQGASASFPPQGQASQKQYSHGQPAGPFQPNLVGQLSGQQTGVIGGPQSQPQSGPSQSIHVANAPSRPTAQSVHEPQQWPSTSPAPGQTTPLPPPQQSSTTAPPPPPPNVAPPVPIHPNKQQQQQQWTPTSPLSPHTQPQSPVPPHVNPLPPQATGSQQRPLSSVPTHQTSQPSTPAPQSAISQAASTDFVAELPADLGNLSIVEGAKPRPTSIASGQSSSYQAYRPSGTQSQSPGPGFTIPRRAVSMSTLPVADPWRFADPATELPTREFYIIADLLFDALDRKVEPQNTGLVEASKMLSSWKIQDFAEEAAQLFAYNSYNAFAKLWSLEGIPHIMVPLQPSLMPVWNFQQQSHAQDLRISYEAALASAGPTTYIPALNRAGFYKYLFLELLHEPERLEKMLNAFCDDTYKPTVLNQPDVQKRDRTEVPALAARAKAISTAAVSRACRDTAMQMQGASGGAPQIQPGTGLAAQEAALKPRSPQMQQQTDNTMNQTTVRGGTGVSTAASNTYKPSYGGHV